jgi:protein ImuB
MFAVIFIPNFSLQAVLRHEPELRGRAVALVDPGLSKPVIVQLSAAARDCGVCEGLTASQATARCGELLIKSRVLVQEASATEVLLQTAYAFSPNIENTGPGICTLELKRLPFRSNAAAVEQWAWKIVEVMAQFNVEAKLGLAETPELALLAAKGAADPVLVLHSREVDSFPISALEPAPEILNILQRWGIRTVGELLGLGRDAVSERLGPAAMELFNRVSPDSPRPLKLVAPAAEFTEQMEFENEIETAEPLLFVLRRFTEQLSRRLELIYLVVAELRLQLSLSSGAKYEHLFKIPAPTGNIEVLFRMLQTHLETVRTDAPITSLRLAAKLAKPEAQQFGLFESTLRDPNQFAETLARLTALCGNERVGTPQPEATHRPDAFKVARAFQSAGSGGFSVARENTKSPVSPQTGMSALRLRRFRPPLPSQVEFRDAKPVLLRSHVFVGPIVEMRGPFLSSGNWWDPGRWAREEWDVETADGSLFRIFKSPEGCFVEGVYD